MQLLLRLFKQFWASKGSKFGEGVDWLKATLKRSCASPRLLGRQENNSLIKRHAECRCERRCDVSLTCKKKVTGRTPRVGSSSGSLSHMGSRNTKSWLKPLLQILGVVGKKDIL